MIDMVVEVVAAERDVDVVVVTDFPVDDVVTPDTEETVVSVGFVTVVVVTVAEALLTDETVVCVLVVVLVDSVCDSVRVVSEETVVCRTVCEVVSDAETREVLVSVVLLLPAESDVSGVVDVVVRMLSVSVIVVVVVSDSGGIGTNSRS